ncbi:MAG: SRPBCC domain-containing protein [Acidimicrobiia bacterium]
MTDTITTDTESVTLERTFDAAPGELWRYLTAPELLEKWSCGRTYRHITMDLDLRLGGVIHHRVESLSDGSPWTFHGVYEEIDPGHKLGYTFDWKADWRQPPSPSKVTIEIFADGDGSRLSLEHSGVPEPAQGSTVSHWSEFLEVLAEQI